MGEGEKSQRTAYARGELILNGKTLCELNPGDVTTTQQPSFLLLGKVLAGRQQQLELKMQNNREAQEESLRRREELIQELELEKEIRRQEREQEEGRRTARIQELNAQVSTHLFVYVFMAPSQQSKVYYLDLETSSSSL